MASREPSPSDDGGDGFAATPPTLTGEPSDDDVIRRATAMFDGPVPLEVARAVVDWFRRSGLRPTAEGVAIHLRAHMPTWSDIEFAAKYDFRRATK